MQESPAPEPGGAGRAALPSSQPCAGLGQAQQAQAAGAGAAGSGERREATAAGGKARAGSPVSAATAQATLVKIWPTILATVERLDGVPSAAVDQAEALAVDAQRRAAHAGQAVLNSSL
jgi:hypothetical protein